MGWNGAVWPAAADEWIYIDNCNDLVAAIEERQVAYGGDGGYPVLERAVDGWVNAWDIIRFRAATEYLITKYYKPPQDGVSSAVWTKASCLQEAIGQEDWSTPLAAADVWIHPVHYNELRLVLNKLEWLSVTPGAGTYEGREGEGWDTSYSAALPKAEADYATNSWVNLPYGAYGGVEVFTIFRAASPHYGKKILSLRVSDYPVTVPAYGVTVSETKIAYQGWLSCSCKSGSCPVIYTKVYDEANFSGSNVRSVSVGNGNPYFLAAPSATAGTTMHYSMRADPEDADPSVLDSLDVAYNKCGHEYNPSDVFNKLNFAYNGG